ncbi:arsenate reductase (glutaredoxin) [Candidatus Poribacteria bacterium]|nr:arsenate reductase (glutaredoxin) [Candidatus Poribacteria bacterium]
MARKSEWTIYHNPRCSKSRAALAYLEEKGIQPEVVEYLKTPLDRAGIQDLLTKLGLGVRDILRDGEDEYDALNLGNASLAGEALIDAVVKHPILMQRPIIVRGDHAAIGRPTEAIDDLIDG